MLHSLCCFVPGFNYKKMLQLGKQAFQMYQQGAGIGEIAHAMNTGLTKEDKEQLMAMAKSAAQQAQKLCCSIQ